MIPVGPSPVKDFEEYALEALWHELTHNRQKISVLGGNTLDRRVLETVTQWTARRTYPELLQALGGRAAHQASIKSDGLGFPRRVRRFDRLLEALKIDESAALREMRRLIDMEDCDLYGDPLAGWLAKKSRKPKTAIQKAILNSVYPRSPKQFESELRLLKLVR